MNRHQKLNKILNQLDAIYSELKEMKVSKSTLEALDKTCEEVELDLRESLVDNFQFN